jgi:hypothetical protein
LTSGERKLDPEGWYRAAHSAAYACQCDALRPEPWQPVPANEYVAVTDDDSEYGPVMGRAAAAELLRRLLEAKLSRFEPDPINAIARVEAERAAKSAPVKFAPSDSPTTSSPQRSRESTAG